MLVSAWLVAGCGPQGGTDVGNGRTVKLELRGYEQPPLTGAQSITTQDGVFIEAVWVAIDRIRFVPAANCEEAETEIDIDGPFVADLVGQGVIGGGPMFAVGSDTFCELKVGFHTLDTAVSGAPAELADRSIFVRGQRADGESFTVQSRLNERLELESKDATGFALPAGANPLLLAYEVGSWVQALDLDSLGVGPIVIDEDNNSDRLEPFEDAVKDSMRLFRDGDGDGDLDPLEIDEDNELAD
jgi:hypothetical protein